MVLPPEPDEPQGGSDPQAPEPTVDLGLEVASDGLTAILSGGVPPQSPKEKIKNLIQVLLRNEEVKHGLDGPGILSAIQTLAQGERLEAVVVARGTLPGPGQDAVITLQVELGSPAVGRMDKSGNIDFKDKGPLPLVETGTTLATLTPARAGAPGRDVRGQPIIPPEPRHLHFQTGQGVTLEQDGTVAVAATDGVLTRRAEDLLEVVEIYEVKGNVDYEIGHVEFPGLVRVGESVLSGFVVRCHDLEAGALEPGCSVEATGDVTVLGGIMGCTVKAGGKVICRFIRDSLVACEDDLAVDSEIVKCKIQCQGKVLLRAREGRVVNSQISALKGMGVGIIKSSERRPCRISLGADDRFLKELNEQRHSLKALQQEQFGLEEAVQAQETELADCEGDLREILSSIKDPDMASQRESLMGQVEMFKPMRMTLLEGVQSGRARISEIKYEIQRLGEKVESMEALAPAGVVWLDVLSSASSSTEIRTARASLVLQQREQSFSAREAENPDDRGPRSIIKLSPLRAGAH